MTETRKGELYIIGVGISGSLFPILTTLSLKQLPALWALFLSVLFAVLFFLFLLIYKKKLNEIYITKAWLDIFAGSLIIGIFLYTLLFFGLKYTSAGNSALVSRMEVVFSYIFFHLIRKEEISKKHIYGIAFMFLGAITLLSPGFGGFNKGDILILLATLLAPLGNFFQRRARSLVSSETIMFFRSCITCIGIFLLILFLGQKVEIPQIKNSLPFLALNGILIFGIEKILWLEGIHRISIAKANAIAIFSPLLTLVLAVLILNQPILSKQLLAFVPMAVGLWLLTNKAKNSNE